MLFNRWKKLYFEQAELLEKIKTAYDDLSGKYQLALVENRDLKQQLEVIKRNFPAIVKGE